MAKPNEVVTSAVKELSDKLKAIKQADEDDLGKVSESFDDLASRADEVALMLSQADAALTGESTEEEEESTEEEGQGSDEEQGDEENK